MHDEQQLEGFQLSPPQSHLWSVLPVEGSASFHCCGAVDIEGPLERAVLEAALQRAVEEFEILRSQFHRLPGMTMPLQVIADPEPPPISHHDLASHEPAAQEARSKELLAALVKEPWGEGDNTALRAAILELGAERHRLLLAMPALCSDEAGFHLLVDRLAEWTAEPAVAGAGGESEEEEALQYVDISDWLNEMIEGEDTAVGREFWKKQLPVDPQAVRLAGEAELSSDSPGGLAPALGVLPLALEEGVGEGLEALARKLEVDLQTLLLGCWHTLLWRLTEGADVPLAVAFDGRRYDELEGVVGLLTRYLPVSLTPSPRTPFAGLLQQLGSHLEEVGRFQEAFQWRQTADGTPEPFCPFAFSFALDPRPVRAGALTFCSSAVRAVVERSRLELAIRRGADLRLELRFDATYLPQAERLGQRLRTLIAQVLEAPETPLASLDLLSSEERHQVLVAFNEGVGASDGDGAGQLEAPLVHQRIAQVVQEQGGDLAVRQGEVGLTYAELARQAGALAGRLRSLGVGPEAVVALFLERSPEMVVAQLATLNVGAAFLPLDPAYPEDRLAFMLEDSSTTVMVTRKVLSDSLRPRSAEVLCLEDLEDGENAEGALAAPLDPHRENLAYLIYTSGSSGRPKGVAITHGNLARSTAARFAYYREGPQAYLLLPSFAFDSSVAGIYWTLCAGGTLVLPEDEPQNNPTPLAALVATAGVTHLLALPSLYDLLLEKPASLAGLNTAIVAGEACTPELVTRHHRLVPGARLFDEYGPTEATVWSTVEACLEGDARVSIGRPVPGGQVYLLDSLGWPVAVGLGGELVVAGGGVGRGYAGRPALTAERFVPDPFAAELGARLYRTGDLARHRDDGRIDFLGRIDSQVKIRGYRIELGEIEALLGAHPELKEVAVAVRGEGADLRLVAFCVAALDLPPTAEALRGVLLNTVPEYMVPAAWVMLDRLPRTPNGKVDRKALPEGDDGTLARGPFVAPRTPVEEMLAGLWADVLNLPQIGAADNFFDLGGHSLSATRVITRINEAFEVELNLPQLFGAPTPAQMAEVLAQSQKSEDSAPPLQAVPRDGRPLPLSFAQQRLWFLDQLEPGGTVYNVPSVLRLRRGMAGDANSRLNEEALERSLEEIVARHEVLRTTFVESDGQPQQVIHEGLPGLLVREDLRHLDPAAAEEEAMARIRADIATPFDLAEGPLLRLLLLHLEDSHLLLFNTHHIVTDLWSMGVFVRELGCLYQACCDGSWQPGETSPLAPLELQYADFALWQREWLQGTVLEEQLAYWRQQFACEPQGLALPADHPRPAMQTFRGARVTFQLPAEASAAVEALGRQQEATVFMTLLALFQVLLQRYSGQHQIHVGTPVAGRNRRETEDLIGFFVNTLVLRADFSGGLTLRQLLVQVRSTALGAYAHQDLPFEQLVEDLRPHRDLARSPLFEVMFALQNAAVGALEMSGVEVESLAFDNETTLFDASLWMRQGDEILEGALEYNTDLFERSTISRMVEHFSNLVASATADPDQGIGDLALLSAAERDELLLAWKQEGERAAPGLTLADLFAEQVRRTPEAVALVSGEERLNYAELDQRVDFLARRLVDLGVGPEVRVGVCLERRPWMVAALLAVNRAGGAWVPLDPAYPAERLGFMLEDSAVEVLVSRESLAEKLSQRPAQVMEPPAEFTAEKTSEALKTPSTASNLALVIYTSGSTGRPKGVALEQRGVAALLTWAGRVYSTAELAGVLASTSVCFDLSVFEIFLPLVRGGTVILAQDALDLPRAAAGAEVSLINTVPSAMTSLLDAAAVPKSVRTVNLAGEPLRRDLVDRVYKETSASRVLNLYGPSEDTTYSTFVQVPEGTPQEPTIGRPVDGGGALLLGAAFELVPQGALGELYLGGHGLARGYLGRPGLTAERFLPDPFGGQPGARLYRTGDLALRLRDGALRFLGRRDHQVKVRGFRIELGEIEAAVVRHPDVRQAVVVVRHSGDGDPRLVCYLAAGGEDWSTAGLKAHLKASLPSYMMPSAFEVLEALPLTPNGKVDRAALPAPGGGEQAGEQFYVAPSSEMEEALVEIWQDVLEVERVGIHDNFFELGGHSLLATRVVARLQQSYGTRLPLRSLFELPTVAQLAPRVSEERETGQEHDKIAAALAMLEGLSEEEASKLLAEEDQ